MKRILLLVISILHLVVFMVEAQNVGINETGNAPNSHAILDINSDLNHDKGVLLPRLTTTQRTSMSLSSSETGLTVFDTNTASYWFWDGSQWVEISSNNLCWSLTGNSNTVPGTNYIGTSDNNDFVIKTNGNGVIYVSSNGNVGIGTNSPSKKLHVDGEVKIGEYVLPSTDGAYHYVLKTDGAGNVSWLPDNGEEQCSNDYASGGVASASGTYSSNSPEDAFDDNPNTGWGNNNTLPCWLEYDLGSGNNQIVNKYTLYRDSDQPGGWGSNGYSPAAWEFQGSNDGSTWTTLDSRSGEVIETNATKKEYSFNNTTAYRYYRIYITANNGGGNWANISEMEFMECYEADDNDWIVSGDNMYANISGNVGIGISSPEALTDITNSDTSNASWSDLTSENANLGEDLESGIIVENKITSRKHSFYGIPASNITFRARNNSGDIWNIGSIQGVANPYNGTNYMGGLLFLIRGPWDNTNPPGRKTRGGKLKPIMLLGEHNGTKIAYINGYTGLGVTNPSYRLQLPNNAGNDGTAIAYAWSTYSDARIKFEQKPVKYGLKEIMEIRPKEYKQYASTFKNGKLIILDEYEETMGIIAQELYKIIPEAVNKPEDDSKQLWNIDYNKLIPVLIKAMQEQQQIIEKQNIRIKNLEKEILQIKGEK